MKALSGFTLVELLVTVAIATVLMGAFAVILNRTTQVQTGAMARNQLDLFRRDLIRTLNSDIAWKNTVEAELNSSSMACLKNGTPCQTDQNRPFALFSASNNLVYNSSDSHQGVSPQGMVCSNFSQDGNDQCPYHYTLTWSALCPPGPASCAPSLLKITADFAYKPKPNSSSQIINPADFKFVLYHQFKSVGATLPVCGPLTHVPNAKTFSVAWTAGVGNGDCRVEFLRKDGTWTTVTTPALVNCDADGASQGIATLPASGWLTGAWDAPVSIRLVRQSDGMNICDLGTLSCVAKSGANSPTPLVDEDCDNQWDNSSITTLGCGGFGPVMPSGTPGDSYNCPTPVSSSNFTCPYYAGPVPFVEVYWQIDGLAYQSADCSGVSMPIDNIDNGSVLNTATGIVPPTVTNYSRPTLLDGLDITSGACQTLPVLGPWLPFDLINKSRSVRFAATPYKHNYGLCRYSKDVNSTLYF